MGFHVLCESEVDTNEKNTVITFFAIWKMELNEILCEQFFAVCRDSGVDS